MEKIREFIGSHKKIVVPVIAAAVLLLAGGFVLAAAALTGVDDGSSEQTAQFVKTEDGETEQSPKLPMFPAQRQKAAPAVKVQADHRTRINPAAPASQITPIPTNGQIIRRKSRSGYLRW